MAQAAVRVPGVAAAPSPREIAEALPRPALLIDVAMAFPPYVGRAAGSADVIAKVEALLARDWDPQGTLMRAAQQVAPHDFGRARSLHDHAAAVCGLFGAGGSEAEVCRYLRREEEAVLPEARTTPAERGAIARAAWRITRGIERPGNT